MIFACFGIRIKTRLQSFVDNMEDLSNYFKTHSVASNQNDMNRKYEKGNMPSRDLLRVLIWYIDNPSEKMICLGLFTNNFFFNY